MKKILRALAVAALVAVPVVVMAQVVAQDGQRTDPGRRAIGQGLLIGGVDRSDSTFRALTLDPSGSASTVDADRDRNFFTSQTLIDNWVMASGAAMADSSTPLATHAYKRLGLMIYGIPDSASNGTVRLALQIRAHLSASTDTLSTFPWIRFSVTDSAATGIDSVGHGANPAQVPLTAVQATQANSSLGGVLPGEIKLTFNDSRRDTTDAGGNGKPFSSPVGFYIPLSHSGDWFWAPYTSVRVRVLNGVASRFRIRIYLVGTAT